MGYKVAVVGATGNVGREMLNILDERKFPADEVVVLASRRSMGVEVSYGERTLKVKALENYDFSDVDICLMSAGGAVSKEWSPKIGAAGAVVIDNSSAWRMDPDVPLIVPEVNADAGAGFTKKNIIANPNCSTAQLVVALKPLHDAATIKRVVVATYQSVSGAGKNAMDELFAQTRAIFVSDSVQTKKFPKRIAFNVIPHTAFASAYARHLVIKVAIAHGEGNYTADDETYARLEAEGRVAFRYCDASGNVGAANPNGSASDI